MSPLWYSLAEDVEEFDPRHPIVQAAVQDPQVEDLLGIAVHVDGLQLQARVVVVGKPQGAVAVSRRRAGVDEADVVAVGPLRQMAGVEEIVAPQVVRVPLRGGRAGPEVDHRLGVEGDVAVVDHAQKLVLVDVVLVPPVDEVLHFSDVPRWSTMRMSSMPSALSFQTKALPMKPAPPVTMIMMRLSFLCCRPWIRERPLPLPGSLR
jgi:hypothetical protein